MVANLADAWTPLYEREREKKKIVSIIIGVGLLFLTFGRILNEWNNWWSLRYVGFMWISIFGWYRRGLSNMTQNCNFPFNFVTCHAQIS